VWRRRNLSGRSCLIRGAFLILNRGAIGPISKRRNCCRVQNCRSLAALAMTSIYGGWGRSFSRDGKSDGGDPTPLRGSPKR
jgi:hypothetical protein